MIGVWRMRKLRQQGGIVQLKWNYIAPKSADQIFDIFLKLHAFLTRTRVFVDFFLSRGWSSHCAQAQQQKPVAQGHSVKNMLRNHHDGGLMMAWGGRCTDFSLSLPGPHGKSMIGCWEWCLGSYALPIFHGAFGRSGNILSLV